MSANNGEAQACTGLAARVNAQSMARYDEAGEPGASSSDKSELTALSEHADILVGLS
ncbi:MAG: hypothetical protein Q7J36_06465 [Thiobacillus sp.]|nr:hypothetical protein [Thiobacillus sp.]